MEGMVRMVGVGMIMFLRPNIKVYTGRIVGCQKTRRILLRNIMPISYEGFVYNHNNGHVPE